MSDHDSMAVSQTLPRSREQKSDRGPSVPGGLLSTRKRVLLAAAAASAVVWMGDAALDYWLLSPGQRTFLETAFTDIPLQHLPLRILNVLFFIVFGLILARTVSRLDASRKTLFEAYHRLRQAEEIAHLGHWELDIATGQATWSDQIHKIFGIRTAQTVGAEFLSTVVHPEDWPAVEASLTRCIEQGVVHDVEYRIRRPDGEQRWLSCRAERVGPLDGGRYVLRGISQDVTERREAAEQVTREREFLQEIIDGVDDPILVIDQDYTVVRLNRAAAGLTEQGGDVNSPSCHGLFYGSAHSCCGGEEPCPQRRVLDTGEATRFLHHHRDNEGNERIVDVAVTPLFGRDGGVRAVIEFARDVTDHFAALDQIREEEERYCHLAHHDPLTGLPNRVLFVDRLGQAIHSAHRHRKRLAVLFVDLDGFKHVNDSFDHSYGDRVLQEVSERLSELVREDDTLARLGGDEFTFLLREIDNTGGAGVVARKILDLFTQPFSVGEHRVFLGACIGVSVYPNDGRTPQRLIKNADAAMNRAKARSRNSFQFYTEDLTAQAFARVTLESRLHLALERNELVLFYQPQIDMKTGEVSALEALLRWNHSERGMVSPASFIPLAEDTGLILPIGAWVLTTACAQMKRWLDAGILPPSAKVCVNLSARQFEQPDLVDQVKEALAGSGLPPSALEVEVTESCMMTSPAESATTLHALERLGVTASVDDFGTGYSSLSYLKHLPLTKLKIDRSFVSDIPEDPNDMAITRAVIGLAKSLSLKVVAEGVETTEQASFLDEQDCDYVQGFLCAEPLPAAGIESYLQRQAGVKRPSDMFPATAARAARAALN